MTPTEILTLAKSQYNVTNENFFTEAELLSYLWAGCMELARKAYVVERVYTTTSVASQQEYSFPSDILAIKRITYDGQKLSPISFKEDDVLTLGQDDTTETGTPEFYSQWNEVLYLRPIPATSSLTIKVFAYAEPQEISIGSTLEVPSRYHLNLADYVTLKMAMKDSNANMVAMYQNKWNEYIRDAIKEYSKKKRGDTFHVVKDSEGLLSTILGTG